MSARRYWYEPYQREKRALRDRLAEMQRHRCAYCFCDIRTGATLEHLIPVCKRGPTSYENCVVACLGCNQERGSEHWGNQHKRTRAKRRAAHSAPRFMVAA